MKKNEILAKFEFNFQTFVNEIKLQEKNKSYKIHKLAKEIFKNIRKNDDFIERLMNNMIVDDFEIDEVLNFKGRQFEIDEK